MSPFKVGDRVLAGPQNLRGTVTEVDEQNRSVWVRVDQGREREAYGRTSHIGEWSWSDTRLLSVVDRLAELA